MVSTSEYIELQQLIAVRMYLAAAARAEELLRRTDADGDTDGHVRVLQLTSKIVSSCYRAQAGSA